MNFLVYLHSIWITHKKLFVLFSSQQNYREIFENLDENILQNIGCNTQERASILEKYRSFQPQKIDEILTKLDVKIITFFDDWYPPLLKYASQVPFLLYVRGKIDVEDNFFAVVWSRKMSPYSKKVWQKMIGDLSEYFTIVSGWAWGCDTLAHQICVEKNKKTIVVFGTWIDQVYPAGNAQLFEKVILSGGALLSIFPIGTSGSVYTFPVRNEVVAGMSRGVLVLEAGIKSGTLITAQLALEQGKDVFAVPGDIFHPNFEWSHTLIQSGWAQMVVKTEDILEEYQFKPIAVSQVKTFQNPLQQTIFDLLKFHLSLNIDEIMEKTWLSYSDVSLNVSMMELSWDLKKDLFGKYERIG